MADPGLVLLLSCEELELISSSSSSSSSKFILLDIPSKTGRWWGVEGKHVSDISFPQIDFHQFAGTFIHRRVASGPKRSPVISRTFRCLVTFVEFLARSYHIELNSCGSAPWPVSHCQPSHGEKGSRSDKIHHPNHCNNVQNMQLKII